MSIELVLYILFGVIIFFSFISGYVRGLRKSVYFLLAFLVFWVSFFLLANVGAKGILSINFYFKHLPEVEGMSGVYKTLTDYLSQYLAASNQIQMTPELYDSIAAICMVVAKLVFLLIYWLIFSFISNIVWLFFKKKKANNKLFMEYKTAIERYEEEGEETPEILKKNYEKQLKLKQYNKKRLFGVLVNTGKGFISCFLILCVVNSVINMVPNLKSEIASTDGNNNISLYDFIIQKYPEAQESLDIIYDYQDSFLNKSTKIKIGDKSIDDIFFDALTSGKSNEVSFKLREQIQIYANLATKVVALLDENNKINVEELSDNQVILVQDILSILADNTFLVNLLPTAVMFALSMEEVSDKLGETEITYEELKNIKWSEDINNIGVIFGELYNLQENGTLKDIDYLNMDTEAVNKIMESLGSLSLVQTMAPIALKYAATLEELEQYNLDVEELLANVDWTKEFTTIGSIYEDFVKLSVAAIIENSKDEGKVDILTVLTSLPIDSENGGAAVNTVVDSLFSSTFINNAMPMLVDFAISSIKDEEIKGMINVEAIGSSGWENEFKTILSLISELSNNGTQPTSFKNFDYGSIANISENTILKSTLLKDAVIQLFIDSANGTGLAKPSAAGNENALATYIDVPANLKVVNTDPATGKRIYDSKWYDSVDKYGELHIMLSSVKSIIASIGDFKDIGASIPAILESLDVAKYDSHITSIFDSQVMQYTISKSLNNLSKQEAVANYLILPNSIYENQSKIIKVSELNNLVNVLSKKTLDISPLLVINEETGKTQIALNNKNKMLDLVFTVYDKETADTSKIDILVQSKILMATISNFIVNNENVVVLDEDVTTETYNNTNNEAVSIPIIKNDYKQFTNLIKAFVSLDRTVIDSLISENQQNIDYRALLSSINEDILDESKPNSYSSILHATLSKQIFNNSDMFVIPLSQCELKSYKNDSINVIASEELIKIVASLKIEEVQNIFIDSEGNILTDFTGQEEELISSVLALSEDSLLTISSSLILRATVSKHLLDVKAINVPNEAYELLNEVYYSKDSELKNINIVSTKEVINMVSAIKALDVDINDISDIELLRKMEASFIDTYCFDDTADSKYSAILHSTISTKLAAIDALVVTDDIFDGNYIEKNELRQLFVALGEKDPITGLNDIKEAMIINDGTNELFTNNYGALINVMVSKDNDFLDDMVNSKILISTISKTLVEKSDVFAIPLDITEAKSHRGNGIRVIVKSELRQILNVLKSQETRSIFMDVDGNFITNFAGNEVELMNDIMALSEENLTQIIHSKILRATASKYATSANQITIKEEAYGTDIAVLCYDGALNNTTIDILIEKEILNLSSAIKSLNLNLQAISEADLLRKIDTNFIDTYCHDDTEDRKYSSILHATLSVKITQTGALVIEDRFINNEYIDKDELRNLFNALGENDPTNSNSIKEAMIINDGTRETLGADFEKVVNIILSMPNDEIGEMLHSKILAATIAKNFEEYNNITVDDAFKVSLTVAGQSVRYLDYCDETGHVNEVLNAILGIKQLFSGTIENTFANISVDKLVKDETGAELSDENNYFFKSNLLLHNFSLKLDNNTVVVVPELYANDIALGMIVKSELKQICHSLLAAEIDIINENLFTNDNEQIDKILNKNELELTEIFKSKILSETCSSLVKDEFVKPGMSVSLPKLIQDDQVENYYANINYVDNSIDSTELVSLILAMQLYQGGTVSITNIANFTSSNNDFFNELLSKGFNQDGIKVLMKSKILAYNVRGNLISENAEPNSIFRGVLQIESDDVWDQYVNDDKVFYLSNEQPGDIYQLMISLYEMYRAEDENGEVNPLSIAFKNIVAGNANLDNIKAIRNATFCKTVTDSDILVRSIPAILHKIVDVVTIADTYKNMVKANIDAKAASLTKSDWRGTEDVYTDGQLYYFLDAVVKLVENGPIDAETREAMEKSVFFS